jgi:CRISPR-associated endonuclease Csn1
MSYILGLDLGPSSIGWAAVDIDGDGNYKGLAKIPDGPNLIPAIGARIFPAGVERLGQGKKEQTRNKTRREKRGTRRTLRRRRSRRAKLVALLRDHNIIPQDDAELQKLQQVDPYELRAKAIEENKQLTLSELGRIFLHLCKKRGFKSNRKAPPKKEEKGEINEAKNKFKEELGSKTPGQLWYEKRTADKFTAIKNKGGKFQGLATREQYKEEFNKIWENQKKIYQKNGEDNFFSVEMKEQVKSLLFDQIPYKQLPSKMRKLWGRCSLMPKEFRCSLANRKAQQFRFLQKVNDLRVIKRGASRELNEEERKKVIDALSCKDEVKLKGIRKELKLSDDERLNFEFDDDNALIGNEIDSQLCKLVGKDTWLNLAEDAKEKIWKEILRYIEDETGDITEEKTADEVYKVCGIKIADLEKISEVELPDGNVKFCEKVIDRILPKMQKGLQLSDAIKEANKEGAGFERKWDRLTSLPVPDKKAGFYITNPNVATVLYQVHRLVNRLIAEIGKPEKIVIEFTRDLKASKKQRQKILRQQAERRKAKELIREEIQKLPEWKWGKKIPKWAIEKYTLWEEQKWCSPYSGNPISESQLFSEETQIDHILPYSMSLDDSLSNKVVCFTAENQDKKQRTVFDWLGNNEKRWERVQQAIDHWKPQRKTRWSKKTARKSADSKLINERKWERFFITADQVDEIYEPERYLNEAGYIANETRDYLERLYDSNEAKKHVKTTKGGVTGELRKWWDLNSILGKNDEEDKETTSESSVEENASQPQEEDKKPQKKERSDLRHHAIDAAVIAVTEPKTVKKVTNELQQVYPRKKRREIYIERPWKGFEDELIAAVDSIKISHRTQRKVCGELHAATHYWKETNGKYKDKYVTRKFLANLSNTEIEQICDEAIKRLVKLRIKEKGGLSGAFDEPIYLPPNKENKNSTLMPVRKVRIWTKHTDENMIPIRGKEGEPQTVWVEKPENHHIEIFHVNENSKKRYICKIWNMWEVSQRIREYKKQEIKDKDPIVLRKHPAYPKAEFVMWLAKADTVLIKNNEKEVLARITGIGEGDERDESVDLKLWELRVNCTSTDLPTKETKDGYRLRNVNDFMAMKPRKVTVDLLGRIRWAERKYWDKVLQSD